MKIIVKVLPCPASFLDFAVGFAEMGQVSREGIGVKPAQARIRNVFRHEVKDLVEFAPGGITDLLVLFDGNWFADVYLVLSAFEPSCVSGYSFGSGSLQEVK